MIHTINLRSTCNVINIVRIFHIPSLSVHARMCYKCIYTHTYIYIA